MVDRRVRTSHPRFRLRSGSLPEAEASIDASLKSPDSQLVRVVKLEQENQGLREALREKIRGGRKFVGGAQFRTSPNVVSSVSSRLNECIRDSRSLPQLEALLQTRSKEAQDAQERCESLEAINRQLQEQLGRTRADAATAAAKAEARTQEAADRLSAALAKNNKLESALQQAKTRAAVLDEAITSQKRAKEDAVRQLTESRLARGEAERRAGELEVCVSERDGVAVDAQRRMERQLDQLRGGNSGLKVALAEAMEHSRRVALEQRPVLHAAVLRWCIAQRRATEEWRVRELVWAWRNHTRCSRQHAEREARVSERWSGVALRAKRTVPTVRLKVMMSAVKGKFNGHLTAIESSHLHELNTAAMHLASCQGSLQHQTARTRAIQAQRDQDQRDLAQLRSELEAQAQELKEAIDKQTTLKTTLKHQLQVVVSAPSVTLSFGEEHRKYLPSMAAVDSLVHAQLSSEILPAHMKVLRAKNPADAQMTADFLAKQFAESEIGKQVVKMLQSSQMNKCI